MCRRFGPSGFQSMQAIPTFSDAELLSWVAESLDVQRSTAMESALRDSAELQQRLSELVVQHESGQLDLAEIWRRRRLTCPSRSTWSAWLVGRIGGEFREYLEFHLDQLGCRFCAANVADLQSSGDPESNQRVRKFFETSVGRLRDLPKDG